MLPSDSKNLDLVLDQKLRKLWDPLIIQPVITYTGSQGTQTKQYPRYIQSLVQPN